MAGLPGSGEVLAGRYRLGRRLAAGGMGAVFEAEDLRAGGALAIKLLHPELASDPELRRRFRREASILRALEHPAIVRIAEVGDDEGGLPYTAMELLAGETLAARVARGPVPPRALVPVVRDVCEGLRAVHAHGVIHADLKPANLFLVDRARFGVAVKLVDFGLSKVQGLERLTRTGEAPGTPTYMAPELLTGEGRLDRRLDVYSLGVVAFEALAGRPPFAERNPGRLLLRVAAGAPPDVRTLRPEVPVPLAQVVRRAMARRAEDRFQDAGAFSEAFAAAVERSE
ncbi:MAG: serine/threonine-protein kinase [Myxococcota bacterium]